MSCSAPCVPLSLLLKQILYAQSMIRMARVYFKLWRSIHRYQMYLSNKCPIFITNIYVDCKSKLMITCTKYCLSGWGFFQPRAGMRIVPAATCLRPLGAVTELWIHHSRGPKGRPLLPGGKRTSGKVLQKVTLIYTAQLSCLFTYISYSKYHFTIKALEQEFAFLMNNFLEANLAKYLWCIWKNFKGKKIGINSWNS